MGLTHFIALPLLSFLTLALTWDVALRYRRGFRRMYTAADWRQTALLSLLVGTALGAVLFLSDDALRRSSSLSYAAVIGQELVDGKAFSRPDVLPQEPQVFRSLNNAIFVHHFADDRSVQNFSPALHGVYENSIMASLTFEGERVFLFIRDRSRDGTPWYFPTFAAPEYVVRIVAPPEAWVDAARRDGRLARRTSWVTVG